MGGIPVTDNRMTNRVKVMFNGSTTDADTSQHPQVAAQAGQPPHSNQALQVLTMAQRTAEEHIAKAHHQAGKIHADAVAAAEQMARDAQAHAHGVRREADKVLYDARQTSEQAAREARIRTDEAHQAAERIVAEAEARAAALAEEADHHAEQLGMRAQQRYDDVVGSLGTKRSDLQRQIEALEEFEREYRGRLASFMQGQLRALWVDQPQVGDDLPDTPVAPIPAVLAEPTPEIEADEHPVEDDEQNRD
jgi:cell division septum initiation protein DivIVA